MLKACGGLKFMRGKRYTFFIASSPGKLRKVIVPAYVLHGIAVLALIGAISVTAAVGSYSRMLWKVGNYNALRHDQETLKKQYKQLQSTVNDTNQRLDSLQSLATEVAMTYGVLHYHPAAFDQSDNPVDAQDAFDRSIEQYTFLKRNAAVIAISSSGLHLLSPMSFADSSYTPEWMWLLTMALRFMLLRMESSPSRRTMPVTDGWWLSIMDSESPPGTRTFPRSRRSRA